MGDLQSHLLEALFESPCRPVAFRTANLSAQGGKERSRICRKARDYSRADLASQPALDNFAAAAAYGIAQARKVSECFLIDRVSMRVVIDTQTLLDWQFFGNAICRDWSLPGAEGGWSWLATAEMRDELAHVLARGLGDRWTTPVQSVLDFFDRHAVIRPSVEPKPSDVRGLRCSDPDDQKFIDLAIVAQASTLVTRDKALLRLRKAAWLRHGVAVVQPVAWRQQAPIAAI